MLHKTGFSEARQRLPLTPQFSEFTPSGTPKILSTGASPRSYSAASSPKLFSGAASPTSSHYDIRLWSSSSQQSSVPNSPPRSHSVSGLQPKHFHNVFLNLYHMIGGLICSHPHKSQTHYLLYSSPSAD